MRLGSLVIAAVVTGLIAALPVGLGAARAGARTARPDTMEVDQIRPGMKGHGLTVFEGTEPERFDIEVIDVLRNFQPRQDMILIKTRHPRLDVTKVVAGMSGSPIFIGDKMVGAYAYGWTFAAESVAGVTPIANMIEDLMAPLPKGIHGFPLSPLPKSGAQKRVSAKPGPSSNHRFAGDPTRYNLVEHARELRQGQRGPGSARIALAPVATPLLLGGLTRASSELIEKLVAPLGLEPVQAGGGGAPVEPEAPRHFVNGGAIGVNLIRGDINAMGLGTVTRVEGDRLVAFGHPMMQAGVSALPTSIARVLWFLASEMRSFKIGTKVRDLGTLVNDRQASIVVSESVRPPLIPLRLVVHGLPGHVTSRWNFELAHEKFMAPTFAAAALGNALQAVVSERQDTSWIAKASIRIADYGVLKVEDFGVSVGGTPDPQDIAQSNLVHALGAVLNNPWETAFVESVDVEVEVRFARDVYRLRGAELLEAEVDAGQPARIRLVFQPYAGKEFSRVVSVPLPTHLAGSEVKLQIRPGYMELRDKARVENLADLIHNIEEGTYPPRSLVIGYEDGVAVAFRGHVARALPLGALDVLQAQTSSVQPARAASMRRHVEPTNKYVIGTDHVSVTIRPILR